MFSAAAAAAAAVPPFEMKCCLWLNLIEDGSLIHSLTGAHGVGVGVYRAIPCHGTLIFASWRHIQLQR